MFLSLPWFQFQMVQLKDSFCTTEQLKDNMFQFQMVQLKGEHELLCVGFFSKFQFQMVQLKDFLFRLPPPSSRSFNSKWFN